MKTYILPSAYLGTERKTSSGCGSPKEKDLNCVSNRSLKKFFNDFASPDFRNKPLEAISQSNISPLKLASS